MDASTSVAAGQIVADKYRVDAVLGEGGMGVVVAATNLMTEKRVALKRLLPRFAADDAAVQRFLREARAAGRIDHPNVVDIYDVGQDRGVPFLVMELLRGVPLATAMAEAPLDPASVVRLLMPACRGLHAVHEMGLVHRDLKPDNVFLCQRPDGTVVDVKVLDFGISKAIDEQVLPSITKTGSLMGTPHYMAPEQIRGLRDIDRRADVYSLGVILYQALTGALPFNAETFTALAVEIATATVPPLREHVPDIPAALEDIVLHAIARNRDERFQDVSSLARALEPFGDGSRFDDVGGPHAIEVKPARREFSEAAPTLDAGSSWPASTTPEPRPAFAVEVAAAEEAKDAEARGDAPEAAPVLTTGARLPSRPILPWVAGGIAALLVVAIGVYAVIRSGQPSTRPAASPPAAQAPSGPQREAQIATPSPEPAPSPEPEPAANGAEAPSIAANAEPPSAPTKSAAAGSQHRGARSRARGGAADTRTQPARTSGVRTSGVSVDDF